MPAPVPTAEIATVRAFNRQYTRAFGFLNERLDDSRFSLAEARVLYELAHGAAPTAAELGRLLGIDKGQLSRIVARFAQQGWISMAEAPRNARRQLLSLTATGRSAFADLDRTTELAVAARLARLDSFDRTRMLAALQTVSRALEERPSDAMLREPKVGDLSWISHRQARLYHEEFGWDCSYEALVGRILSEFAEGFDPKRERAWVAEIDQSIVGSIFLMKGPDPATARLRLLYVEPAARGRGIGALLVERCIAQARAFGYAQLELWTNSVLTSARRIYEAAEFQLVGEESHRSFGHNLVGQTWALRL